MKHEDIKKQLVEFADGELTAEETSVVETHLKSCDACREEIAELQASLGAVREGLAPVPERWAPLNAATVENRVTKRRRFRQAIGTAGLVAACALVLVVGLPREPEPTGPTEAERAAAQAQVEDLHARIDALEAELAELKQPQVFVVSDRDLSNFSAREEIAAILVQAGKSLEEEYGFTKEAQKRYRYTAAQYGDTQAAADARNRIIHY